MKLEGRKNLAYPQAAELEQQPASLIRIIATSFPVDSSAPYELH